MNNLIASRNADDRRTWERVYDENCYGVPDSFHPSEVVLDLGAHIGAFSRLCMDRGARVFAAEPCLRHLPLYYLNTHHYYCTLFKVAVWGDSNVYASLTGDSLVNPLPELVNEYVRKDPASSVYVHPTNEELPEVEDVDVMALTILIILLHRNIAFLKISCNGSEYAIIYDTQPGFLRCCRTIAVECMNTKDNNEEGIRKHLIEMGFHLTSSKQLKKDHHLMRFSL